MAQRYIDLATKGMVTALDDRLVVAEGLIISLTNDTNFLRGAASSGLDVAAAHNAIYRGKNITAYYNDGSLFTRISSGTFEDIYIGDYFDVEMPAMGELRTAQTTRFVIAALDYYYNCGDTSIPPHHAVIIPYGYLFTHAWNENNSTEGGYVNSDIHTVLNSDTDGVKAAYQSVFGENLLTYRDLLTNAVNMEVDSPRFPGQKGASSGWAWYDVTLRLMSEIMVYGSIVWSSSGFDTGCACEQLPYFRHNASERTTHRAAWFWLSDVVSGWIAANADIVGAPSAHGVSYTGYVRPLALIS